MALQAQGTVQDPVSISFGEIETEFGQNSKRSLGSYRISDGRIRDGGGASNFDDLPLDTGIPQSGTISLGDFYSKKLNVFVDCYSGNTEYRINARTRYNNDTNGTKVKVIGGFRNKPTSTKGTKVIIHVNKTFGSQKGNANYVALRTGSGWDNGTSLIVDVGSSGAIYGAGGNGGKGQVCDGGAAGKGGTSALGIEYSGATINVYSGGKIQAGYGGGGGGGGGHNDPDKNTKDHASSGGGGGGGAGLPAGNGGKGGDGSFNKGDRGSDGNAGSTDAGGAGGDGGDGGGSEGGTGGTGASPTKINAGDGGDGAGNVCNSDGTGRGANGAAIRKTSGISFTIINSGTVNGSTTATGVS
jgi:hypothetical protein